MLHEKRKVAMAQAFYDRGEHSIAHICRTRRVSRATAGTEVPQCHLQSHSRVAGEIRQLRVASPWLSQNCNAAKCGLVHLLRSMD